MLDILPTTNIPKEYSQETWYEITNDHLNGVEPGEYFISTYGRIFDLYNNKYFPNQELENKWYKSAYLRLLTGDLIQIQIHRFMMYYFNPIENWEKLEVNHKDGIKYHNWIWNLEWTTHKQNMTHARNYGLTRIGDECPQSVVTNTEVEFICSLISEGKSPLEIDQICKQTYGDNGIDYSAITDSIKNNYAWTHISSKYDFSKMYHRKYVLDENQIHAVCKIFEKFGTNLTFKQVLELIGIDYTNFSQKELNNYNACICSLRNKKFFKQICSLYKY